MNNMKRQKGMTPEDEPLRLEGVQCATGEEQKAITNSSRKNEGPESWAKVKTILRCGCVCGESKVCLVQKLKFNAVKNNIA